MRIRRADVEIPLSLPQMVTALIALLVVFTLVLGTYSAPSVWSFPRFVIAVVVVVYLPGKLLLDTARLRLSPLEDLALALVVGMVVSSLVFWGASFLALADLFVLWPLAATAVYLCRSGKIRSKIRHSRFSVTPSHLLLLGVITAGLLPMAVLPFYYRNLALLPDGGMSFKNVTDTVFHLAIAQELTVSVPPQAPFLSGQPLSYHYAMDLLAATLNRAAWLGIPDLTARFLPTLFLVETVLAVFVLSRAWLKSSWGAVLTSFLVILGEDFSFIPGLVLRSEGAWSAEYFAVPTTFSLYYMNPMLPALAVLCAGLFCLLRFSRENGRGWLMLTALLFAALTEYKVFSSVHVLLALAVTTLIYLLFHRNTTPLRVLLLTSLLTAPLVVYAVFGTEASVRLSATFEPWPYIPRALAQMGLFEQCVNNMSAGEPIGLYTASALLLVGLPIYLLGSLGLRAIAIPQLLRDLLLPNRSTFFGFFLAVLAVAGPLVTLTCTVTRRGYPVETQYNEAVWFYVQSKYIIWLVATGSILSLCRGKRRAWQALIVSMAIMLAVPSSAQVLAGLAGSDLSVVETGQLKTIGHLEERCTNGEVVLAQPSLAVSLVALSPCRVPIVMSDRFNRTFVSQAEMDQRRLDQSHFWDAWDRGILHTSTLERYGISYVVLAKGEKTLLSHEDVYWIGHSASREEVVKGIHPSFENHDFVIYEISPVPIEHLAHANVGNVVSLLGSSASTSDARPGTMIDLTLWWHALARTEWDYTVFTHVVDGDGRLWAQEDRLLSNHDELTSEWEPGDVVRTSHQLILPCDMPSGSYVIKAGLYYWETGARLPVRDEEGRRLPDDAAPVETITLPAGNCGEG